jgi:hypothetical protein
MTAYRDFQGVSLVDYLRDALLGLADIELFPQPGRLAQIAMRVRWPDNELPLFVLDDTNGDAERGFFVTSEALYVLGDGRRCGLSFVQAPPQHPQGEALPGFLPTAHGPFAVPSLVSEHRRVSFRDAMAAIVRYNQGDRELSLQSFAKEGAMSQLVVNHLLPYRQVRGAYRLSEIKLAAARRTYLMGLDHLGGERVLALVDGTLADTGGETGMIFTDRRLLVNSGVRADLPYAAISHATHASGVLTNELVVTAWDRPYAITLGPMIESLQGLLGFFHGLSSVLPHSRYQEPVASNVEPRTTVTARNALLAASRKRLVSDDTAADLRIRLDLVEQTLRFGRGAREGWYESPLGKADLRYALGVLFGAPQNGGSDGRMETFDYVFRGRAQAHLPGVGVAWMLMPMSAPFQVLRAHVVDFPGGTGFALNGMRGQVSTPIAATVMLLNYRLAEIERDLLYRRILFGPEVEATQLAAIPAHAVGQRAAELGAG